MSLRASLRSLAWPTVACVAAAGCSPQARETADPAQAAEVVNALADRYYAETLERAPEVAYLMGVELERHDGIEDNRPEARRAAEAPIDEMLASLREVDAATLVGRPEWITHAYLLQALESSVAERVCRFDLWYVSQMDGWHTGYTHIARLQPTGTPELREQSLARWSRLPGYIDQEVANLQQGLELGYSAPRAVVRRVLDQLDGLLALDVEDSPFYSPAARDEDPEFADETRALVQDEIYPALRRYRDFLAGSYLERAREALTVTANPDGRACYEASVRGYTTLDRSGEEIYELGRKTVAENKEKVVELGRAAYGLDSFEATIERAGADPEDRFSSREELLEFSRDAVRRAELEMPSWVGRMPGQPVAVVPFEEYEEGTGLSPHYRPGSAERPGEYRIPLHQPEAQSRGGAEVTAFHETWPGHHLQVAAGRSVEGLHPATDIIWFSGPGEGWARYSEALAEEMGLYTTTTGPILRRAWPARGMVVDPGIHLFGWTREQAVDYMMESGSFPEARAEEGVDRIAILPGQLTAYDSGGLEILALRKEAEEALGADFDIREFHDRVLENGAVPLRQLRAHVEAWIADQQIGD